MTGRLRLQICPGFARFFFTQLIVSLSLLLQVLISNTHAQVTQTIGPGNLGTQVNQVGNIYEITQGTRAGSNLFHSFGNFSISSVETARFQTTNLVPDATIGNILGRVTGGNPSTIFGTINSISYYPVASLFLMNPAGIVFGPNAAINVGGMAHFTTADYLKLDEVGGHNAGIFHADPAQISLLTTAPVTAFGFLGSNPAAIAVQGSQLTMANGTGFSLIGGNRGFNYTDPDTGATGSVPGGVTMTGGVVLAPSGQINITSVASTGEISTGDFIPSPGMTMGTIALSQGAILNASGDGGGAIRIRGGEFVMDQSALIANTTGASDGSPTAIGIKVTGGVSLDNGSALIAWATNAGRAGNIEIVGRTIDVAGGSFVYTNSLDSGLPGNTIVTGSESISVRGDQFGNPSEILSDSQGSTSSGSIMLRAPLITLSDMGAVETRTFGSGPNARAGDITVEGSQLNLLNGGMIQTVGGNDSPTGNISITATNSINLLGTNDFGAISNITNQNISGGTGNITIHTGSLGLSDRAMIFSSTWIDTDPAAATTPKIAITADSSITLSTGSSIEVGGFFSDTGRLELATQNLTMSGTSRITTLSSGTGAAGPILINLQNLTVSEGSQILSFSSEGIGRGGDITINATGSILVTGHGLDPFGGTLQSGIFSYTKGGFEDPSITGNAGNISITGQSIDISNGARIDSSSQMFALGNAGNIDLMAPSITVNGGTISTSTEFSGQAGTITLRANTVSLSNGGQLASNSIVRQTPQFDGEVIPLPTGNAGTVTIQGLTSLAQSVLIDGTGSSVFTDTQGTGAGGNISLNANSVTLQNGGVLSAKTSGSDTNAVGGTITVNAEQMVLSNQALVTAETNGVAPAGAVEINTGSLAINSGSQIRSSSGAAVPPVVLTLTPPLTGGTVSVQGRTGAGSLADSVAINGTGSGIFTGTEGVRPGGDLNVSAQSVSISNGALVTAATTGTGAGGAITINAGNTFASSAGTVSSTASQAQGGDITITAGNSVTLSNNSLISASSTGPGNAGNILINAGQNYTSTDSAVTTQATAPGTNASGGNIMVLASDQVRLTNSQLNASVQGSSTTVGGNITIDPQYVILQNSQIIAQATQGQGGNISITTNLFLPDSVSIVNASSQFGVNGTVNIQSPLSQLGGKLSPLPKNSLESTTWINSRCRALAGGQASSFVVAGREMLPAEPGGWLGSPATGLTGEPVFSTQVPLFPQMHNAPSREGTVSLRRMTPPGFFLQAFATDWSADCTS